MTDETPKKKGFFKRAFGLKSKEEKQAEEAAERAAAQKRVDEQMAARMAAINAAALKSAREQDQGQATASDTIVDAEAAQKQAEIEAEERRQAEIQAARDVARAKQLAEEMARRAEEARLAELALKEQEEKARQDALEREAAEKARQEELRRQEEARQEELARQEEQARLEAEAREQARLAEEAAQKAAQEAAEKAAEEAVEKADQDAAEALAKKAAEDQAKAEQAAREKAEAEKAKREQQEAERAEKERLEQARLEAERFERERLEQERLEKERQEAEQAEAARLKRLRAESEEAERRARVAAQQAEREAAERELAAKRDAERAAQKAAQEKTSEPDIDASASGGFLDRISSGLRKSTSRMSDSMAAMFNQRTLDDEALDDLQDILIASDLGVGPASKVATLLSEEKFDKKVSDTEIKIALADVISDILTPLEIPLVITQARPQIMLFVGVNGSGKTTTLGKLAKRYSDQGLKVMLAAGDTFRAAAVEQLKVWGERAGAPVVSAELGADAAGLVFDAIERAKRENIDILMIDTAGRLQNRTELMDELAKVLRVIKKLDPSAPHHSILVLDATVGQNALSQVDAFQKTAEVSGLIMTKLDGTAKGGVLVALSDQYKLPIHAIGIGERIEDLENFSAPVFAAALSGIADDVLAQGN